VVELVERGFECTPGVFFCAADRGFSMQLNKRLRDRDKRWQCERWYEKKLMGGQAEIFFIDTNPFILDYHLQPWANNTGRPPPPPPPIPPPLINNSQNCRDGGNLLIVGPRILPRRQRA